MNAGGWSRLLLGGALFAASMTPRQASAATIVINSVDGSGEGLNDSTPTQPVGGNSGTTLGAQRLIALQKAADIWAAQLDSPIAITLDASMDPLSCSSSSGVLGSATANNIAKDFSGAPLANHWYAIAQANSLAGVDLLSATADIRARFNSELGTPNCLSGTGWYLGLDGNHGDLFDLVPVALHELAHGLGFITFVNGTTGANFNGVPDVFQHFMLDTELGLPWDTMSDAQRASSAQDTRFVAWTGALVSAGVPGKLSPGSPLLLVTAPQTLQGEVVMTPASFGPALSSVPVTGELVLAIDGGASTTDGCQSISNDLTGKVALIDRGTCAFTNKVHNAQNAGAVAVLIADNVAGSPPGVMVGSDAGIGIPSARITLNDGSAFKSALESGAVLVSMSLDPSRYLGADAQNRALLFTPQPLAAGSSLSHWDPLATPDLLMEPTITPSQDHGLDLTRALLLDIGWHAAAAASVPATPRPWLGPFAIVLLGVVVLALRQRRLERAA